MSNHKRVLVLGPAQGWHAERLTSAAHRRQVVLDWGKYESLSCRFDHEGRLSVACAPQESALGAENHPGQKLSFEHYDHVLARTMPVGSLEQITLRLSALHCLVDRGFHVANPPSTLELAIDKFRTLARITQLGYPVPETRVVQTRREAMEAYRALGGDVVVKPIFGGEGRGVMRVRDPELAWYTFATLERIDAAIYVQKFVPPGGADTRLLVIGDEIFALRRFATESWKTNVSQGGRCESIPLTDQQERLARRVASDFNMLIGTVDLLDTESGPPVVVEVNAVPGWKGAEAALGIDLADRMIHCLLQCDQRRHETAQAV